MHVIVLFLGLLWYREPGVAPDAWLMPAKSIEECEKMKRSFTISAAMLNADRPPTAGVTAQTQCLVLANPHGEIPS